MKNLIIALILAGSFAKAGSRPLETAVQDLTNQAILVRVGFEKCKVPAELTPFAGSQLEQAYIETIASLTKDDKTQSNWSRVNKGDCLKTCTCSALSRVYESYSKKLQKMISIKDIEKKLAKMDDGHYRKCLEAQPKFCENPKIQRFIEQLKTNGTKE